MFTGAFTALVTPFKKGVVDYDALADHVEFQISEGISGVVPCGTTGESSTLSHEEHHRVVEFVIKQVRGRVPVIAGAGSNSTTEAVSLAAHAKDAGADAVLLITPYYNKPTQEGLFLHFSEVARLVKIPIILYNVPGRTSVNMLPSTVARLSTVGNIIGIKEATGDLKQISELIELVGDDFVVLSGDDFTTLPILSIGGKGVISVHSNLAPKDVTEMVTAYLAGDRARAAGLHFRLLPLARAMFIETSPVPAKAALAMMNRMEPDVRLPLAPMSEAGTVVLKKTLKDYGLI